MLQKITRIFAHAVGLATAITVHAQLPDGSANRRCSRPAGAVTMRTALPPPGTARPIGRTWSP
jgi:hypothetical protein